MTHPLQQISFTEPNQAYVIEASAGTGKTWTIERLYIKALLEANQDGDTNLPITVENILVVTFTNDATDELKQRISEQIQSTINLLIYLLNNEDSNLKSDLFIDYLIQRKINHDLRKDVTLLTRALQNFDQSAIFTIHGFCNRILQDYQFECQTSPDFELVPSKQGILEDLVRNFLRQEIFNNVDFAIDLPIVEAHLASMFSSMEREHTLIQRISDKLPKDLFIIKNNEYHLKYSLSIDATIAGLKNPELSEEDKKIVKAEFLALLIKYIQDNYARESAKIDAVSYDELIQIVADNINNSPDLSNKLYHKYPVAFIDEFQDTDSLQWQIFSTIYHLNNFADHNRRGNVVVVGDPKQAIYRFRGADVETYLEARTEIGNQLELSNNFRSRPEIMNFINQLFSLENQNIKLEDSFLGSQIGYSHVEPCGSSKLQLPTKDSLQTLLSSYNINQQFYDEPVQLVAITGISSAERKTKLLQAMTFEILSLLNADSSLKGKIAIIVTKNREASEIVAYLRKYGVKAAELKLGNIFATNSAKELYQILLACEDLSNRKNFLKSLSAQLFNLPLAQLVVSEGSNNETLEVWYKRFFEYNSIWQKRGIISLVYRLLEDVVSTHNGLDGVISNRELANLYQLAEILNKQSHHVHNQSELMYWFKNKLDSANDQLAGDLDGSNEELVRLDNDDEQIVITTQHKSKGLEYEILFCPYFKSGVQLDGQYDFNYRRPFFSSYRENNVIKSQMIMDKDIGSKIVHNDNKEIHRLNYVALTRAKSRIYIYLKQPTISKTTGKYNTLQRPDKLVELFGYVADNPNDDTHSLFNYPQFFGANPQLALKKPNEFSGVVVYQRSNILPEYLSALSLKDNQESKSQVNYNVFNGGLDPRISYTRQSYSGITSHDSDDMINDWFIKNESLPTETIEYRFSILNDPEFKGATFGTLFHSLCEEYPFSDERLSEVLKKANLNLSNHEYLNELKNMLDIAFNYPLVNGITLNSIPDKLHELEFNLQVNDSVELRHRLSILLTKYYGAEHPFTLASKTLGKIEQGFLVGFIDLFFAHDGKYWVLDYKTNHLNDYTIVDVTSNQENTIINSMSEHHYYLQYMLYLVAIKRYLEQRLDLDDASHLIGGAVYFYVRGAFTVDVRDGAGIFVDTSCQNLVRDFDSLLKGMSVC